MNKIMFSVLFALMVVYTPPKKAATVLVSTPTATAPAQRTPVVIKQTLVKYILVSLPKESEEDNINRGDQDEDRDDSPEENPEE